MTIICNKNTDSANSCAVTIIYYVNCGFETVFIYTFACHNLQVITPISILTTRT